MAIGEVLGARQEGDCRVRTETGRCSGLCLRHTGKVALRATRQAGPHRRNKTPWQRSGSCGLGKGKANQWALGVFSPHLRIQNHYYNTIRVKVVRVKVRELYVRPKQGNREKREVFNSLVYF